MRFFPEPQDEAMLALADELDVTFVLLDDPMILKIPECEPGLGQMSGDCLRIGGDRLYFADDPYAVIRAAVTASRNRGVPPNVTLGEN